MLQAGGVTTRYRTVDTMIWGPDPAISGTYLVKISNKVCGRGRGVRFGQVRTPTF